MIQASACRAAAALRALTTAPFAQTRQIEKIGREPEGMILATARTERPAKPRGCTQPIAMSPARGRVYQRGASGLQRLRFRRVKFGAIARARFDRIQEPRYGKMQMGAGVG